MIATTPGLIIDPPGARDRDDAVWVERTTDGWDVAVHIADLTDTVRIASTVDVVARRRAASQYLPERTVHMLPSPVVDAATLIDGGERPTCVTEFHVASNGTVSDIRHRRARLTDGHVLSYADAAAALTTSAHPLHNALHAAQDVAAVLHRRRQQAGALAIYDLASGWVSDGDTGLRRLSTAQRHSTYIIVAELMIAANAATSTVALDRGLPIIFRNHRLSPVAPPHDELMDDLRRAVAGAADPWSVATRHRLPTLLRPATYDAHVSGHYGLRIPSYCHSTSPLRRYPDLIVQRQIIAAAQGDTLPYSAERLATLADELTARIRQIRRAQRDRDERQRRDFSHQHVAARTCQNLHPDAFREVVKVAVTSPAPPPEVDHELQHRLTHSTIGLPDAYQVLFVAHGQAWQTLRGAAMRWLTSHPEHAASLLNIHRQLTRSAPSDWYDHETTLHGQPHFTAAVTIHDSHGTHRSRNRTGPTKTIARRHAALNLIATLAGLPDPSPAQHASLSTSSATPAAGVPAVGSAVTPTVHTAPSAHSTPDSDGGRAAALPVDNPVGVINEWQQHGVLTTVSWDYARSGPSHSPLFTCTMTATHPATGHRLTAEGTGPAKNTAKSGAAVVLVQCLLALQPQPTPPSGDDARTTPSTQSPALPVAATRSDASSTALPRRRTEYNALSTLNAWKQAELITSPIWTTSVPVAAEPPSADHRVLARFQLSVTATHQRTARELVGSGSASSKATCRRRAAKNLCEQIRDLDSDIPVTV
jgi:ribonuclease R